MQSDKDLYRELRTRSCQQLLEAEIPAFERAGARERVRGVALIRAVGVVFAAQGTKEQRVTVREWLRKLLRDPEEKVRRYAMAALPKIGAGESEEGELISLLQSSSHERERKHLGQALNKIGGEATLEAARTTPGLVTAHTEQKVKASVARKQSPSSIQMDGVLKEVSDLKVVLRCRRGLEGILRDEVKERFGRNGKFRITGIHPGIVLLAAGGPFSLADIFTLRCFATAGFVVGTFANGVQEQVVAGLARAITSKRSREIFRAFSNGAFRYRLDFIGKGHQRGGVAQVIERAYALCPEILNDAREAPWAVDVHEVQRGLSVELRPKFAPDPRLAYRKDDVDAASHPPLAAAMVRLAGRQSDEVVWDPFCGSGLELAESLLAGGVKKVFGTDVSSEAVQITQMNLASVQGGKELNLRCGDFRDWERAGIVPHGVSLMVTNPPMGRRIRVPNLRGLFVDLFDVAAAVLRPGGRLVFANPMKIGPRDSSLKLKFQQVVDLGGFDCRLELWEKQPQS